MPHPVSPGRAIPWSRLRGWSTGCGTHGLPSTAAMLPDHKSPCNTDGLIWLRMPTKSFSRLSVASSTTCHCLDMRASAASFT
eukprot:scaffold10980_cov125-Isochrysis_galbana.AAC.10